MKLWMAILLFAGAPLWAAQTLTLKPESTLWLEGDSTLHPFSSKATQLTIQAALDPKAAPAAGESDLLGAVLQHQALKQLDVVVPVHGLKSKESGLDKNMYKALKAEANPEITFHMSGYEISPSTQSASASHVKATGTLKIAGKEQTIGLEGDIVTESSALHVLGKYDLLMSDYGIKPPTMMMGAIKVKDKITVHFDLQLHAAVENTASTPVPAH